MSKDDEAQPIGEVLGDGFRVAPLLPGWTALEGIVLVKCLNADGHPTWAYRDTAGLNDEELIGALTVQLDLTRRRVVECYYDDEDED